MTIRDTKQGVARLGFLFAMLGILALTLSAPILTKLEAAQPIIVNTTDDEATSGDGFCSLREALNNANAKADTTGGDCVAGTGTDAISFSVSGTITLSGTPLPAIQNSVTIDGTGQTVTVSANNLFGVFNVDPGATFNVNDLTIANGNFAGGDGGGILNNGTLMVSNSTFTSDTAGVSGGAIFNDGGTLTVSNTTFTGDTVSAGNGGAIGNFGPMTVTGSTFSGDLATAGNGGAIDNEGTGSPTVSNCTFAGDTGFQGGAILNNSSGTLTLTGDIFSNNNSASGTSDGGGAIYNQSGTLDVTGSTFFGNSGTAGGAIFGNTGALSVTDSSFTGNSAIGPIGGGGAIHLFMATLAVMGSSFADNTATGLGVGSSRAEGGAIDNGDGQLTVSGSSFSGNSVPAGPGGGIFQSGQFSLPGLSVTNCTFSGNKAVAGGGIDIISATTTNITNSTFSGNSALDGGGIITEFGTLNVANSTFSRNNSVGILNFGSTVNLKGTVLGGNTGGNCASTIGNGGGNISDDASCGFGTSTAANGLTIGDNVSPGFDPFGLRFNGGSSETIALQLGSPAIDAILIANCPAADQRGFPRPDPDSPLETACDSGAFESGVGPSCVSPPSGLVSWWPGDDSTNDIVGSNNGIARGGLGFAAGEVKEAFAPDGTGAYVNFGNDASLQVSSGDFSVDAWVSFNSVGTEMSIVDKMSIVGTNQDGWRLFKAADDHLWFCFGGGSVDGCTAGSSTAVKSITAMNAQTFYHVTGVKTSKAISIYVNGALEATTSPFTTLGPFTDTNSADLTAGSEGGTSAFMNGLIDEIELFNRALSPADIQSIIDAGPAGKCKPSPTPTPTATATITATSTPTATTTATATATPTVSATASATATTTATVTTTATPTKTATATPTATSTATASATSSPTATATRTVTPTTTVTVTPTPTATLTPTATATETKTATATATQTATATATPTATATATPTATATATLTRTATATNTASPTATSTPTATATASASPSTTVTATASATQTASATPTVTATNTVTATPTATSTPRCSPPDSVDQCKKGGWRLFTCERFKNQGECVSFVRHENDALRKIDPQ